MKDAGRRSQPLACKARVIEALPRALYRVELLGEARGAAIVHVSGDASLLRLLPGDEIVVELMPYDATRGRVVKRVR